MSDLISRSELIDYLDKERKQIPIDSEKYNIDSNVVDGMISALQAFEDKVKEVETAYDIDKVIEKLEEIRAKKTCNKEKCDTKEICRICVVDDAIEIVKQGSVSDDECEWRIVDRPHNLPIYNTSCGKNRLQCATGIDIYCNGCGKKIKVVE